MARTFYADNLALLRNHADHMEPFESMDGGDPYKGIYIGSFMSLDPCGRYHHALSPNGCTHRCESFWASLEKASDRLGGWIESGEGDPLDTYFCMAADAEEDTTPDA